MNHRFRLDYAAGHLVKIEIEADTLAQLSEVIAEVFMWFSLII